MFSYCAKKFVLLVFACVFVFELNFVDDALSQTTVATTPDQKTPTEAFKLDGFRSAHFNMSEKDVRDAITSDFNLKDAEITEAINNIQRTRSLSVNVPNLLADGGIAQVSYVFGYKSKTLIQIGVTWNAVIDPTIKPETLAANGDVLQAYFLGAGYKADTITTGAVLNNGLLLFRGSDRQKRTTILLLQGKYRDEANNRKVLDPDNLTLLYSLNAEKPDVFQVQKGKF